MNEQIVAIDSTTHRSIERMTDKAFEMGGTMKFNADCTSFVLDSIRSGQFAHVKIPRGIVQFHTHTSSCQGDICTLSIPSVRDLVEFTRAFMRGDTLIHCLYSADGCYCISITPEMAVFLSQQKSRKEWSKRTITNMTSFYAATDIGSLSASKYNEFRDNWITLAQVQGISIRRYNRGEIPRFCLVFRNPHIYAA